MKIRIINGTFGLREKLPDGSWSISVHAKTRQDPPFEVDEELGIRLISEGIAEAAEPAAIPDVATGLPDAEENAEGGTLSDAESGAEGIEEPDGEDEPDLESLNYTALRMMALDMGIDTKPLRSKNALIAAIAAFDAEAEDDGEQPPALDADELIV